MSAPPGGGWPAALTLALVWALAPVLPALAAGAIPGSPWTDLYPSVWGLGWFAAHQPGFPLFATELAAPDGMPFYYSSPLHGWAATPLAFVGGPVFAWTATLVGARFLGVVVGFACFRAAGIGPQGALAAAGIYAASPFFHGYAVEGIVEGTDAWTLPLWALAVLRGRTVAAGLAFALIPLSSWYLGIVAVVVAAGWGLVDRRAWTSAAMGLALAAPFAWAFTRAMSGATPLPDEIRAAMGAPLRIASPGVLEGTNPFALSAWVGLSAPLLALPAARERRSILFGAALFAFLSLGVGPHYELPVLASIRFPYRWHAGTLFCLALVAGHGLDALLARVRGVGTRTALGTALALVPVVEGALLSPVEPILPSAPADVPAIYDDVVGAVLLDVPGPVAMPPGVMNASRPRSRYLLYYQLHHGRASPWAPDFNGVAATPTPDWLSTFASWDPLTRSTRTPPDVAGARAAGVRDVMVHRAELRANAEGLVRALEQAGAARVADDGERVLLRLN